MTIEKDNTDCNKRYGTGFKSFLDINKMYHGQSSKDLLELKRKAVESEESLRNAYSQQRNMKLGFTEQATKLFAPITTGLSDVKKEIHEQVPVPLPVPAIGAPASLPAIGEPPKLLPLQPAGKIIPQKFDESLFGLHQEETFAKDKYIFGVI